MKNMQEIIKRIDEELNDAQYYAERANEQHEAGHERIAREYRSMSDDELHHAMEQHTIAVRMIDDYQGQSTPDMLEKWKASHKAYMEKSAMIRSMIEHVV